MKTQHTKGKWRISSTYKHIVLTDFGSSTQSICDVYKRVGETEANAKLIAAAPELLEALMTLRHELVDKEIPLEARLIMHEAIKKATE